MDRPPGRPWTIAGFVLAGLAAVTVLSILTGPIAVALGVVGLRAGDPLGRRAIIAGVAGMVVGLLVGELVY